MITELDMTVVGEELVIKKKNKVEPERFLIRFLDL
jgi:hypothetical protein